jgi:flagellar L-ring protein precursor FlgH
MNRRWIGTVRWSLVVLLFLVVGVGADVAAPRPQVDATRPRRRPMTLAEASWIYQPPAEPRELKLHDLIVVLVDEKTQVISEGEMDRRKKADGTFTLADWIVLDGLSVSPDPQSDGEPAISGKMQSKYRAESELETRDSMKFRISCRVVDVRPNGNLLLEGRRAIRNNNDTWEMWLMGAVRPEDVLPNNTVLSENVADLRIIKRESGHVRDGYRRGFLMRFLDYFSPI